MPARTWLSFRKVVAQDPRPTILHRESHLGGCRCHSPGVMNPISTGKFYMEYRKSSALIPKHKPNIAAERLVLLH